MKSCYLNITFVTLSCKPNIVGRKCDTCLAGHFFYPYCEYCDCDQRGTTEEICDQTSSECFCKKNVRGPACNFCVEGTYNLQAANPDGCTECFCFGKTTRCLSSSLIRIVVNRLDNWTLVLVNETGGLNVSRLDVPVGYSDQNGATADLYVKPELGNQSVYFAAPAEYLGRKMSSYGGRLNYTVYYTIGLSGRYLGGFLQANCHVFSILGKAVSGSDLILQGADTYLKYESLEQPPAGIEYTATVELVEQNFLLPSGIPAKREHVMTVLQNLKGVYIRASYWSVSETTRYSCNSFMYLFQIN